MAPPLAALLFLNTPPVIVIGSLLLRIAPPLFAAVLFSNRVSSDMVSELLAL